MLKIKGTFHFPIVSFQYVCVSKTFQEDESSKPSDSASVHYVMIPQPRTDLINVDIERAVSRMQVVVELGRVLRDRKTMPLKYPLPELVVIHKDHQYLSDVESLKSYILATFSA